MGFAFCRCEQGSCCCHSFECACGTQLRAYPDRRRTLFTLSSCSEQDPATSLEARYLSLAKSQFRFSFELEDPSGAVSDDNLPFSQREIADGDMRRPRPKYKVRHFTATCRLGREVHPTAL